MPRFFLSSLATVAAGAFAAAVLHFAVPAKGHAASVASARFAEAAAKVASRITVPAALRFGVADVYASVADRLSPDRAKHATLLLNQPVSILQGREQGWTQLPRGTAVQLVSADGAFLQVKHARNIVTVPRSAFVTGATRTN